MPGLRAQADVSPTSPQAGTSVWCKLDTWAPTLLLLLVGKKRELCMIELRFAILILILEYRHFP